MKQVDAILTADWHLRDDRPISRTDDFFASQRKKLIAIQELQTRYDCPVYHAGDLFHNWKASPFLLSEAMMFLPDDFYTVYGQHDLPQHSLDLKNKSGINVLDTAGFLTVLDDGSFGEKIMGPNFGTGNRKGLLLHKFVWDGKKIPWPGCEEVTAEELLDEYNFDLIVSGDHHKPFVYEKYGRLVVNPGCLTRQAADYADHQPRVYLYEEETNTVEPAFLPINIDAISREHIEQAKARDKRIDAFIARLNDEWKVAISFEENLARFLSNNHMRKSVTELIYKAIENGG